MLRLVFGISFDRPGWGGGGGGGGGNRAVEITEASRKLVKKGAYHGSRVSRYSSSPTSLLYVTSNCRRSPVWHLARNMMVQYVHLARVSQDYVTSYDTPTIASLRVTPGAPQFSYKLAVEHTGSGARVTLELPVMASNFLPGGMPWPDEVTSLAVPKAYLSGAVVPVTIHIDKHVPPPPRPPFPPTQAIANVFKFTATDQGSKKRKSTNPKKL
ncbi:hypothetical protein ZWY2020_026437 [Hordeum vulgare]|nr:hypothetical protein ZWY2020_026437 [Hordeum vulgare]